jgi:hypothetical protein
MSIYLKALILVCLAALAVWGGIQYTQKTELSVRLLQMEAKLKRAEDRYEVSVAMAKASQAAAHPVSQAMGTHVVEDIFNKLPMNPDAQREALLAELKPRLGLTDTQDRLVASILHDFYLEKQAAMNKAVQDGVFPLGRDFMTIVNGVRDRALIRLREALSPDQYALFVKECG